MNNLLFPNMPQENSDGEINSRELLVYIKSLQDLLAVMNNRSNLLEERIETLETP